VTVLPFPRRPQPEVDDDLADHLADDIVDGRHAAPGESDHEVLALLAPWRELGVLGDADVHGAEAMCRACGVGADQPEAVIAAALALRAPRLGHTCLDLATVAGSASAEVEGDAGAVVPGAPDLTESLPWPGDVARWAEAVVRSGLVAGGGAPLVQEGTRLYLERYHRYELAVAAEIARRVTAPAQPLGTSAARHAELLDALLPLDGADPTADADGSTTQRRSALHAATRPIAVIVGGPGTGKTHTVAALLGLLLDDHPEDGPDPGLRVALVAPTGKAAARLGESLRQRAGALRASGVAGGDRLAERLEAAEVATLHRLLGARVGSTRFRHHAGAPLSADVVIVDETSMVALPLMVRLLDAMRPDARLVLVGDPGQLASVEAGSVLGDIAGPVVEAALAGAPAPQGPLADAVTVLTQSFRFPAGSPIDRFAGAVRAGDAAAAEAALTASAVAAPSTTTEAGFDAGRAAPIDTVGTEAAGTEAVGSAAVQGVLWGDPPEVVAGPAEPAASGTSAPVPGGGEVAPASEAPAAVRLDWIPIGGDGAEGRAPVAPELEANAHRVRAHAERGDAAAALDGLGEVRVLCAHRRGPFGVAGWNRLIESWLAAERPLAPGFYVGRPILVTANDPTNGVFNGDLGVTVATPGGARVAFADSGGTRTIAPVRLESVDTVHAMTIHKSQGSEFDHVIVVLPPVGSRLATRELLYTAVTRARRRVTLVGPPDAVRAAVEHRVERASGLGERLWPEVGGRPTPTHR
jgi:exodeoxyribonuclease V alpha subunit